jgi:hypothetical protein
LRDADERGDRYASASLRTGFGTLHWLAADDVEGARRECESAIADWSQVGFMIQHYYALHSEVQIDLYAGEGAAAERRLDASARAIERSNLNRIQATRVETLCLRARTRLAAGRGDDERVRHAERDAGRLAAIDAAWARPLAELVLAGCAAARARDHEAMALLDRAATAFDACDMALHAAVARLRRGQLLGGTDGRALILDAESWMAEQLIAEPSRIAALFAPGFRD